MCCRSGLHISLEFFEDLFVPEHYLPEPSVYDEVRTPACDTRLTLLARCFIGQEESTFIACRLTHNQTFIIVMVTSN